MFPILLNLTDRLCVVVGGGPVGRRRAQALRTAGARVRLVCLEARPPGEEWANVDWRTEPYQEPHLHRAELVFAAATPEVNRQIVLDAKRLDIWVNCCNETEGGDFIMPAVVRRGDFVVAIGTGGAAPALSRLVRELLEAEFDVAFGQWVSLLAELRPIVQQRVADAERRHQLLESWCRLSWLDRLRREGEEAVRAALLAELQTLAGDSIPPL